MSLQKSGRLKGAEGLGVNPTIHWRFLTSAKLQTEPVKVNGPEEHRSPRESN